MVLDRVSDSRILGPEGTPGAHRHLTSLFLFGDGLLGLFPSGLFSVPGFRIHVPLPQGRASNADPDPVLAQLLSTVCVSFSRAALEHFR